MEDAINNNNELVGQDMEELNTQLRDKNININYMQQEIDHINEQLEFYIAQSNELESLKVANTML